jgi:hypothetical protein
MISRKDYKREEADTLRAQWFQVPTVTDLRTVLKQYEDSCGA